MRRYRVVDRTKSRAGVGGRTMLHLPGLTTT